jgi:glycosyltransferase involved in cell wall biosynthesis
MPRFSILIPTWNNLPFLKLCVNSLRDHSAFAHEIILHINDGSDGTLDWARENQILFTHSPANVGVCHALNAAAGKATTPYICFFNDDMVALPEWDRVIWEEIQSIGHDDWFLSATMIEPTETGNACAIAPFDFGTSVDTFQPDKLLNVFREIEFHDWSGATWPPNVVPRKWWDAVGGYSEEFSPGMSSDPDFSMKLWDKGLRYFKGVGKSRVYHFQARSTGKVVKNDGRAQFLNKWGITQGTFSKYFLRRGTKWNGILKNPSSTPGFLFARIRGWWKRK